MTERCADLDEFFDGELPADQADRFRDHLVSCERCQRVLEGRMQECIAVRVLEARVEPAAVPAAAARTAARSLAVEASGAPAAAGAPARLAQARPWGCSRVLAYAAPLLAAAAAIPLWLSHRSDPEFALLLAIDRAPVTVRSRGGSPTRGATLHTDDVVRPSVHGEPHRAILVYVDDHRLVAACPGDARCSDSGGQLTLELRLDAPGQYAIVGLGSRAPIAAPGATLDQTRAAARRAGVYTQIQYIDVSP